MPIQNISAADDWADDPPLKTIVRDKARRAAKLPGFNVSDIDDFEQDLWLHLLTRLSCYDPSRASPETFASRLCDNRIRSVVRSARAEKRSGGVSLASLDQANPHGQIGAQVVQLVDDASGRRHLGVRHVPSVDRTDERLDVREIISSSAPPLRMMAALLSHVPQFAAGEIMGISRRKSAELVANLGDLLEAADLAPNVQIPTQSRM
jgi:DNA-directed RNA polymerase specialized sigma24 family protein